MGHKEKMRGRKNAHKIIAAYCSGRIDIEECCRRLGPHYEELIEEHTGGLSKDELEAVINDWALCDDEIPWHEFMSQYKDEGGIVTEDDIPF